MEFLIAGLVLFLGTHSMRIVAQGARERWIAHLGERGYKGLYAVVSLLGLGLIATGYAQARLSPWVVWTPPTGLRHLAIALMLVAMVLLVAAYLPRNGIQYKLRHPMVLSVKVWALAHLICNGHAADIMLFGGLGGWAILCFRAARQRDRQALPDSETAPPPLPYRTLACLVAGIAAWAALLTGGHTWLVGVSPLGM